MQGRARRTRGALFGTPYPVPRAVVLALEEIFTTSARRVRVVEHSRYARLHPRMAATTRPGRILLAGPGRAFIADPELVLHEYFHVLRQWEPGKLTRRRYVWESLCRGYAANRYEREAVAFARAERDRYVALVARFSAGSGR